VEAALAIATLVAILLLCAAGITAVSMQVRCIDAAREAARLAARSDAAAAEVAARIAPAGASLDVRRDGGYVIARVSGRTPLLPGLVITGEAMAAVESGN
jgi:hypothetical protein